MSIFNDKILKGVAEAAAKIMGEQLKGNQHKIDVAEPKGKITGADFAKLRTMKKEETEQVKESGEMGAVKDTKGSVLMKHKTSGKEMNVVDSPEVIKQHKDRGYEKVSTMKKEEVDTGEYDARKTTPSSKEKQEKVFAKHRERMKNLDEMEYGSARKGLKLDDKAEKRAAGVQKAIGRLAKEEVEALQEMEDMIDALIQEYESKGGVYKHKGTYGTAKGAEYGETDYDKENEMAKKKDKPARKAYGARQNYVRSTRVNEGFVSILDKYNEGGLQTLFTLVEEPDSEQFADELKKQERKAAGTAPDSEKAKVAAPATQGVKSMPEEVEQVDERQMTEPEMKEREKIVKGMKKGIAGFKQRYGERAKSVMYATATKQAMKD